MENEGGTILEIKAGLYPLQRRRGLRGLRLPQVMCLQPPKRQGWHSTTEAGEVRKLPGQTCRRCLLWHLRKDPYLSILSAREPHASQQLLGATWWPWLEQFGAVPPGPVLGLLSTGGARHS